jgi:hypothetical protein
MLQLYNSSGQSILTVGGWGGNAALAEVFYDLGAFPFVAEPPSADAAVVTTLNPGGYTFRVLDGTGTGGTALAEVYDADSNPLSLNQHIINLSGRGGVTPDNVLIGGFWIAGTGTKTVLVRGAGPALLGQGVTDALAAPVLQIYDQAGNVIATNSAWGTPTTVNGNYPAASAAAIAAAEASCYAFPFASGSNDTAYVITLPPGGYTAMISSGNGGSGTALFEVYELP